MENQKTKPKVTVPRRLKGFCDFFAADMKLREFVINTFKRNFEKYGYEPLETPSLELAELMVGVSGEEAEKQFYRFQDPGNRDVIMKYEVMTSMCRAVAQNINNIPFPYKRYQIQRVWRAENVQNGRYREFTQCDADTIGSTSMTSDAEFIQMGLEITKELGFKDFVARISNRKFLEGIAEVLGITSDKFYGFCMSLDKLKKIGSEKVIDEMVEVRGIPKEIAQKALNILDTEDKKNRSFRDTIADMEEILNKSKIGSESLCELTQIADYLETANVDPKLYCFDTSLARGLASYTGPVWEFEVIDGGVGSIAGSGRYDKVIGRYLGRDVPATGGSFGIERICDILKTRKMYDLGETTVDVLVTIFDRSLWKNSLDVADKLRQKGIATMLYPDVIKIGDQLKYANKKSIPWVIVIGPEEVEKGVVNLKNMKNGEQSSVAVDEVVKLIK